MVAINNLPKIDLLQGKKQGQRKDTETGTLYLELDASALTLKE